MTSSRHLLRLALFTSLGASTACLSIPSAEAAGISFSTAPSPWPANVECLNREDPGIAKEVLVGSLRTVVVAGGDRPISNEEWETYNPSFGNRKNSTRHLLFTESCFARSPGAAADCAGDACREIVDLDGYTWVALSEILAADCIPGDGGCDPSAVQPGQLAFVVTRKCHELRFEGEVLRLRGPAGEEAIMHATADGNPSTDVALPEGWTLTRETLAEPLRVHPVGGEGGCFYNILRDARAQSYHQVSFSGPRYP